MTHTNSAPDKLVKRYRLNPQFHMRLFCFPYAGGRASVFHSWVDLLPLNVEICPVELPGREFNLQQRPYTRLHALILELREILTPYLNVPFAFFGHSMGALISFELARELRRRQLPGPLHLFISGHRAPQLPDPHPIIHHLPDIEFIAELRKLEGTPEEVLQNDELLELYLPLLRADFSMCEMYEYTAENPLDCSISVFGGLQDIRIQTEELRAWQMQTQQSFSLKMFRGNHFFLMTAKLFLLRAISRDLNRLLKT